LAKLGARATDADIDAFWFVPAGERECGEISGYAERLSHRGQFPNFVPMVFLPKKGTVEDSNVSKTGASTVTVRESDGNRFKTLAKNLRKS
jgi:hypothetical protein